MGNNHTTNNNNIINNNNNNNNKSWCRRQLSHTDGQKLREEHQEITPLNTTNLPVEILELILLSAAIKLFVAYNEDGCSNSKSRPEVEAMTSLCRVSSDWYSTVVGWESSDTKQWFRHQLRRLINSYFARPFQRQPSLLASLSTKFPVCGVTTLNGRIYAVCQNVDCILVYRATSPYERLKGVHIKGLKDPQDIDRCGVTSSLYVADSSGRCVWKVTPRDPHKKALITQIKTKQKDINRVCPRALAVMTSQQIVVTSRFPGAPYVIENSGEAAKAMCFPVDLDIRHCVVTDRQTLIVCHSGLNSDRVMEFDVEGRVLRCFGGRPGNGLDQLSSPRHLAVVKDFSGSRSVGGKRAAGGGGETVGKVFVADSHNDRVLLLDSALKLERVLLDRPEVTSPTRLCYVPTTGWLLVAGQNEIKLFKIK